MKVFYDDEFVGAGYAFDTTRKAAVVAKHIEAAKPLLGRHGPVVTAPELRHFVTAQKLIEQLHTKQYVDALKTGTPCGLAESQGFSWDKGIWPMAVHSTAGVIAAAEAAVLNRANAGSLSSGLHHAKADHGAGFCTVNGLAVAAASLLEHAKHTGKKIVILDFDAHCGGGTNSFLKDTELGEHVLMFDVSTNGFDEYEPASSDSSLHLLDKLALGSTVDDSTYLGCIDKVLYDEVPWSDTSVVLYNAGMDPHPTISWQALGLREEMVFVEASMSSVPVAFVLAGGYTHSITMESLAELHLMTVKEAMA